jgi:hypothetical protein
MYFAVNLASVLFPSHGMGSFMQILAICFSFTAISWNTGQFSTLVTFVSSYGTGSESIHLLCTFGFL